MNYTDIFKLPVTEFENPTRKTGVTSTLGDFLGSRKSDNMVQRLRSIADRDPEGAKKLKSSLRCATISGVFPEGRGKEYAHSLNGLICVDVDAQDNPTMTPSQLKALVSGVRQVAYCSYSARGQGCFAIIRISDTDSFEGHFKALERLFKSRLGIVIDRSCKDFTRLRFATIDNKPYVNNEAEVFRIIDFDDAESGNRGNESRATNKTKSRIALTDGSISDIEKTTAYVDLMERMGVDIAPTRDEWLRVGFALHTLGVAGKDLFERVSRLWGRSQNVVKEKRTLEAAWRSMKDGKGVTIATFYDQCHRYGVRPYERRSQRDPLVECASDFEGFIDAGKDEDYDDDDAL